MNEWYGWHCLAPCPVLLRQGAVMEVWRYKCGLPLLVPSRFKWAEVESAILRPFYMYGYFAFMYV